MSTSRAMKRSLGPHTRLGWWAFGLGLATIAWGLLVPVVAAGWGLFLGGPLELLPGGLGSAVLEYILAILAIFVGVIALRRGERSWMALLALVGAIIVGGAWILLALSRILLLH